MKLGGLLRAMLDPKPYGQPTTSHYAAVEIGPLCVRRLEERRVMAAAPFADTAVDESTSIGSTLAVYSANPPVVTLPGQQTAVEGTALVFSAAAGRAIRIDDPDIGANLLQVEIAAFDASGQVQPRLAVNSTAGLLSALGNGSGTVQLHGTLTSINSALSHITFESPDNGNITLAVTAFDPGTGDAVSQSIGVDVVNANPQLWLPSPQNVPEGQLLSIPIQISDRGTADTAQISWTVFYRGTQVAAGNGASVNFLAANDGHYDVTVTAVDDDGGVATLTQRVSIINVSPGLTLTAFTREGVTHLTGHIDDPGSEQYTVEVYWTQNSVEPFVFTTDQHTFTVTHQYNSSELAAGEDTLTLTVHVFDDQDFGRGSLNFVEAAPVQVERPVIEPAPSFQALERTAPSRIQPTNASVHVNTLDVGRGAIAGKQDSQSLQHFVVRLVSPDGEEYGNYTLAHDAIEDLPGFLAAMAVPDGHYRVYFVSGDQERLVIDGHLRAGRLVDPTDDSLASFDRPPGGELPEHLVRNKRHALSGVEENSLVRTDEVRRDDTLQVWYDSLNGAQGIDQSLLNGASAEALLAGTAADIALSSDNAHVAAFESVAMPPIAPSLLNGAIFATTGAAVVVSRRAKATPAANHSPALHRFSKAGRSARRLARLCKPGSFLSPTASTSV